MSNDNPNKKPQGGASTSDTSNSDGQNPSGPVEDWSPDYFPTSPKIIFRKSLVLFLIIFGLCTSVAYCSEEEDTNSGSLNDSPLGTEEIVEDPFNPK